MSDITVNTFVHFVGGLKKLIKNLKVKMWWKVGRLLASDIILHARKAR